MEELNIGKELNDFLLNRFKGLVGKYLYRHNSWGNNKTLNVWKVVACEIRKDNKVKVKMSWYDKTDKCFLNPTWTIILNLYKDGWFVVDNEEELKRTFILNELEN